MNPTTGPALDYVKALPWAPSILAAGGAAVLLAIGALTRRHPGEAGLFAVLSGAGLLLVFAELGEAVVGATVFVIATALAAAGSIVAFAVRALPGAPRVAPGNEQRVLALAVIALLTGAWLVSGLAVDWPAWAPGAVSALAVALALLGVGVFGLLTRRHWLSLVLAGHCVANALVLAATGLPPAAYAAFAPLFLVWNVALGGAGLALAGVALRRGHGPWVDAVDSAP